MGEDKELILLFKRDSSLTGTDWERFCRRYATRDVSTIVRYIKERYRGVFRISASFKNSLKWEMAQVATRTVR